MADERCKTDGCFGVPAYRYDGAVACPSCTAADMRAAEEKGERLRIEVLTPEEKGDGD